MLETHFVIFYNVIKVVIKYNISNTILKTLQYLQAFHTKSYVKNKLS